jgi:outer membrane protein
MKKLILLSAFLSTLSFAQQKFACIDTNRILQESETAKKAQSELREKVQSYQRSFDEKAKKLEELKKQIESKSINQKTREDKIKEYQKIESEAFELQQRAQRELAEMKAKLEEDLTKKGKGHSAGPIKEKRLYRCSGLFSFCVQCPGDRYNHRSYKKA